MKLAFRGMLTAGNEPHFLINFFVVRYCTWIFRGDAAGTVLNRATREINRFPSSCLDENPFQYLPKTVTDFEGG